MTHMQPFAVLVVGLLLAIGFGVWKVHQATSFIADSLHQEMSERTEGESSESQDDIYGNDNPVGFHSLKGY